MEVVVGHASYAGTENGADGACGSFLATGIVFRGHHEPLFFAGERNEEREGSVCCESRERGDSMM